MVKSIFEEMGGVYMQQGDYFVLPVERETRSIGVWRQRHLRYLKQHRKIPYTNLLASTKLNAILRILTGRKQSIQ